MLMCHSVLFRNVAIINGLKGRDFCTIQTVEMLPNGAGGVLVGTSIVDERCPEASPSVRGTCILAGYVVRPVDGGAACMVDMLSHADLNASIPKFVMTKVAEKQPMNVFQLRKIAEALESATAAAYQADIQACFGNQAKTSPAGAVEASQNDSHSDQEAAAAPSTSTTVDAITDGAAADAAAAVDSVECIARRAVWGRVMCGVQRSPIQYLGGTGKLAVRLAPAGQGIPPVAPTVPDGVTSFFNDG